MFSDCNDDFGYYIDTFGGNPNFAVPYTILIESANKTVVETWVGFVNGWIPEPELRSNLTSMGCFPLNVNQSLNDRGVAMYPNPATDHFSIYFENIVDAIDVDIYNMTGQLIERYPDVNSTLMITTANYQSGMYIVKAGEQLFKVSVQK